MNQAVSENDRITNLHLGFCNEPKYRPVNDKLHVVGLGKSAYESLRRFSDHARRQHREKSTSFFFLHHSSIPRCSAQQASKVTTFNA